MSKDKAIDKISISMLTVDELAYICEEEGIKVRDICRKLKEGMDSDIVKMDTEGHEFSRTPDMPTRHKYMQSAMELFRLVKKDVEEVKSATVVHKMLPEDIDRLEAITKELKGLEKRLITDKVQQGEIIEVTSVVSNN